MAKSLYLWSCSNIIYYTLKKINMKSNGIKGLSLLLLTFTVLPAAVFAQDDDNKLVNDATEAKAAFIKSDSHMQTRFDNSYGYAIFPNVGKGAVGVGGAAGNGVVYEQGNMIGRAKMKQVSVGFQFGGQAYREVIFFENKEALDRFKGDKFEFAAQVSAVAAASGASADAKYREGVLVFTQEKKGLMYEASVGGQKFSFTPNK
jgi:lipid-binding SYLF domain-containing protein